jgi:hypothetical protein
MVARTHRSSYLQCLGVVDWLGRIVSRRNDQRGPRFIDEDAVSLINDRETMCGSVLTMVQ